MKYLKSLNEFFDSSDLRDQADISKKDLKKKFSNINPEMFDLLMMLLAELPFLKEFDVETLDNNISFGTIEHGMMFSVGVEKLKNGKYALEYGFKDDDLYQYQDIFEYDMKQMLDIFPKIRETYNRYCEILGTDATFLEEN